MQPKKEAPRKNYGRSTRAFFALAAVVLIGAGVYGYMQYTKLTEVQSAIASEGALLGKMQAAEKQIQAEYVNIKSAYDSDFSSVRESIEQVFPAEEKYTELTRLLDDFVIESNNSTLNPIFMSNLSFSQPMYDNEKGYAVLAFTLTLETTRENFEKFLQFIENSGSLENGIRLMEVESISLNLPTTDASPFDTGDVVAKIPTMSVNLSLNAYFQLPADTEATAQ